MCPKPGSRGLLRFWGLKREEQAPNFLTTWTLRAPDAFEPAPLLNYEIVLGPYNPSLNLAQLITPRWPSWGKIAALEMSSRGES